MDFWGRCFTVTIIAKGHGPRGEPLAGNSLKKGRDGLLLQGVEQEAKENIGGKQHQCEDDGAAHAAQGAHAVRLLLFLFGFLFSCGFARGG